MFMVMFVLDDTDRLDDLLKAWEAAGVRGATILDSTGIHRRLGRVPMRFFYSSSSEEAANQTLFAIVADEQQATACLRAAEALFGDLNEPNTGVFAAWPLALVKGVPLADKREG
ncbi:MAG: hypothetical protein LDL12_04475 [Anaerolinea sp.]|nr:hypothetical protein [Anaerolinea sp.]